MVIVMIYSYIVTIFLKPLSTRHIPCFFLGCASMNPSEFFMVELLVL